MTAKADNERGPKGSVKFDGAVLRAARRAAPYTQEDLAEVCGVHLDSVRRAERGEAVARKTALAIFDKLGVDFEESRPGRVVRAGNLELLVRVFGTGNEHPDLIPTQAWKCYEALFPIEQERVDPIDIISWIRTGHDHKDDWPELFFTLSKGDACIGIAYINLHLPSRWCFGNYFGILGEWRTHGLARQFLKCIAERCELVARNLKGIVFEVEPFDDDDLSSAVAKFAAAAESSTRVDLTGKERESIRSALRVAVYTGRALGGGDHDQGGGHGARQMKVPGALAFAMRAENGYRFAEYRQPAIREPLSADRELDMWLMIYPFERLLRKMATGVMPGIEYKMTLGDVREILEFLYDDVFPSGYAEEYKGGTAQDTYLADYSGYIRTVRQKVEQALEGKELFLLNRDMVPRPGRRLIALYGKEIEDAGITL